MKNNDQTEMVDAYDGKKRESGSSKELAVTGRGNRDLAVKPSQLRLPPSILPLASSSPHHCWERSGI